MINCISPMKKTKTCSFFNGELCYGKSTLRILGFDSGVRRRLLENTLAKWHASYMLLTPRKPNHSCWFLNIFGSLLSGSGNNMLLTTWKLNHSCWFSSILDSLLPLPRCEDTGPKLYNVVLLL